MCMVYQAVRLADAAKAAAKAAAESGDAKKNRQMPFRLKSIAQQTPHCQEEIYSAGKCAWQKDLFGVGGEFTNIKNEF